MPVTFKKCSATDLDTLLEVSRTTFRDAFEEQNDPEDFKAYMSTAFDKKNIRQQLENQDSSFYFVYSDGLLAGYFKINEHTAQTEVKLAESIELERIYVVKEFQGRQIGSTILQEVLRLAKKGRKTFIWLGVWQKNTEAVRFYERHGFLKFGTHPYFIGDDQQTDWLMRYELTTFRID